MLLRFSSPFKCLWPSWGVRSIYKTQPYFPSVFVLSCCGFNTIRYLSRRIVSGGYHTAPCLGDCLNYNDTGLCEERWCNQNRCATLSVFESVCLGVAVVVYFWKGMSWCRCLVMSLTAFRSVYERWWIFVRYVTSFGQSPKPDCIRSCSDSPESLVVDVHLFVVLTVSESHGSSSSCSILFRRFSGRWLQLMTSDRLSRHDAPTPLSLCCREEGHRISRPSA